MTWTVCAAYYRVEKGGVNCFVNEMKGWCKFLLDFDSVSSISRTSVAESINDNNTKNATSDQYKFSRIKRKMSYEKFS